MVFVYVFVRGGLIKRQPFKNVFDYNPRITIDLRFLVIRFVFTIWWIKSNSFFILWQTTTCQMSSEQATEK